VKNSDYDDVFKIGLIKGARFAGRYEFPVIERTDSIPSKVLPFDKSISTIDRKQWVHFFINDKAFMRIWRKPSKYLPLLMQFQGVFAPDFSIMWNYPLYLQIQSIAKSRAIGSWLQRSGVDVIPTVRWGKEESYDFSFDAIEPGGTIAVGTVGCTKNPEARKVFAKGLPIMLERLNPSTLVVYGPLRDDVFAPAQNAEINIVHFTSATTLAKAAV